MKFEWRFVAISLLNLRIVGAFVEVAMWRSVELEKQILAGCSWCCFDLRYLCLLLRGCV